MTDVDSHTPQKAPAGLGSGGRALWKSVTESHFLTGMQLVQLTEACRQKDRCDRLDEILRGDVDVWATVMHNTRTEDYELKIDAALVQANTTANSMKQLLAALRLPDEAGKVPQRRGARGVQKPTVPGGTSKVSSLDRHRDRAAKKTS